MNTQVNPDHSTPTLGTQFRQAREALNLTLDDVSKVTQLRPSILAQIENDDWILPHIAPIFMRGYVQNYARFLKLPNELWQSFNFGATQKNDLNRSARAKKASNPHSSYARFIGYFTVLVLLIVAGMTALWWWQNHQQSNAERDNLVQNYVATDKTPAAVEVKTDSLTTEAAKTETIPVETPQPTSQPAEQNAVQALAAQSLTDTKEVKSAVENPAVPAVQGDLQIEITAATSWITVKDAKRKNLAQQEYKQGDILTFDGQGPYSLTIGAPANVKITYKGEAYPLTIDGRVARIKLQ